jgi:citronellol/citronellal dehydrogenase
MVDYRSVFRPGLFKDQVIIVTGGGSGIGRCIAHELKSLGARIALIGRNVEKLETVQKELGGGRDVFIHSCDLRQEQPVKDMVAAVLKWAGRIDGLVNNAGGQFPARLRDISLNGWNAVVANNMTATFLVSKEVFIQWMEGNGGNIVSIGADWPLGMPGMGHNGAARAGQENFTLTASIEWAASGVRLNQVIPGFIASSGFDKYPEAAHETLRNVVKRVPLKRRCRRVPAFGSRRLHHRRLHPRRWRRAQQQPLDLLRSAGPRQEQALYRHLQLQEAEGAGRLISAALPLCP